MKYSTLKERLKNRSESIPEPHFKKLLKYWSKSIIQRAKKENREEVTQAEMFVITRQWRKGKIDEETENAIAKLQDSIQNSSEPHDQAFQTLFGKEKLGRVRCYGRTATPTMLKKMKRLLTLRNIMNVKLVAWRKWWKNMSHLQRKGWKHMRNF